MVKMKKIILGFKNNTKRLLSIDYFVEIKFKKFLFWRRIKEINVIVENVAIYK